MIDPPPAPRVEFAVPSPTVLFVDDEPHVCTAVARALRRAGLVVHIAPDPDEGRALLAGISPHVVISDLRMPGEDGISFLTGLRREHPKTQRILLTGHHDLSQLEKAINDAGVHRFLGKPWTPAALVETVRQAIAQWAIEEERDQLLQVTHDQNEALRELNVELEAKVDERTARLERASSEWRQTFDSISEPLALVDDRFIIRRANLATARMAGSPIRTLIGQDWRSALFPGGCEGDGFPPSVEAALENARRELVQQETGRVFVLRTWPLQELTAAAGEDPGRAVFQLQDITEAREMQRQVFALEKLAAVGELAGCVAHELNNPLTGILTFSQIMGRTPGLAEDFQSLAADIEEAARRCTQIVRSLLDFARPSTAPVEFVTLDVEGLLTEVARLARFQMLMKSDVELHIEVAEGCGAVRGHTDSLKSVFLNLINNAVQASRARHAEAAVSGAGQVRVIAAPRVGERGVRVEVRDDGTGVPEALRDRVFKPFFTTKAKNQGGTGLGLAIVSNAVRDHGGRVWVEDAPEGGACFVVELPTTGIAMGVTGR